MCTNRSGLSRGKAVLGVLTAGVAIALWAGQGLAAEVRVDASQNLQVGSSFSLDFGQVGGVASALITDTNLSVAVDPELGSARFVDYSQNIEPLILPGGFSTGAITVEIVEGSSVGTFDPITKVFTTTETYAIHFTGDLSAFGLTSPVLLDGSSTGTVSIATEIEGALDINWVGESELSNPLDPSQPIEFTYACEVHTAFAPEPEQMLEIALIPFVTTVDMPVWLQNNLLINLDRASNFVDSGRDRQAIRTLNSFIDRVDSQSRRRIPAEDAAAMINTAEGTIYLLQTR